MVFQGEMGGADVSGFGHHRGGSSDGAAGCPKWGSAVFRLDPAVLLVRGEVMSAARVCTAVLMGRAWFIPAPWPRAAAWVCTAVLMGRAVSSQLVHPSPMAESCCPGLHSCPHGKGRVHPSPMADSCCHAWCWR